MCLCAVRLTKSIRWSGYRERSPDFPARQFTRFAHVDPCSLRPVCAGVSHRWLPWHRHAGGGGADVCQACRYGGHHVCRALRLAVAHLLVGAAVAGHQRDRHADFHRLDRPGCYRGVGAVPPDQGLAGPVGRVRAYILCLKATPYEKRLTMGQPFLFWESARRVRRAGRDAQGGRGSRRKTGLRAWRSGPGARVGREAGTYQVRPLPAYFRWALTSLVSSNIVTWSLPKIGRSLASALMLRLLLASCRLCFLMYSQIFLVTSVRGT